ncbi:MAG: hypothetical protein JWM36_3403 [Hyphomicrobiales bacterium]|nr:hypothetical protein [Hyphomicrobiales bacterium]
MSVVYGCGLIAVAIALPFLGKARADGTVKPFLRNESVALPYPSLILAIGVGGVRLIVS